MLIKRGMEANVAGGAGVEVTLLQSFCQTDLSWCISRVLWLASHSQGFPTEKAVGGLLSGSAE